jgi:uncharacterized membrane protein YagU involved in acid resistance
MLKSTVVMLAYTGSMLAYGALIIWEIRRGRVKIWQAMLVGFVVVVVTSLFIFPVYWTYRNREGTEQWNRAHPSLPPRRFE